MAEASKVFNDAIKAFAGELTKIRQSLQLQSASAVVSSVPPPSMPSFSGSVGITAGSAAVRAGSIAAGGILGMMPTAPGAVDMQQSLFQAGFASGRLRGREDFNRLSRSVQNIMGNNQTSVGAAQRSAAILATMGFSPFDIAGQDLLRQVGGISLTTGLSNEAVAGTLGSQSTNPVMTNRLRGLGLEMFDSSGNPKDVASIADHLVKTVYGSSPSPSQLQKGMRPGGALDLMLRDYIPDPAMQALIKDAIFKRAFGGSSEAGSTVVTAASSNLNPRKAGMRYLSSESRKQNATRDSTVAGYTTGLDVGSNMNDLFTNLAENAGIISSAFQGISAVLGFVNGFGSTTPGQVTVTALSSVGLARGGPVDAAEMFDALNVRKYATGGEIVEYAKQFVGKVPYVDSATIPGGQQNASPQNGWDCATFTWYVLKHFGINAPNYTGNYLTDPKPKVIPKDQSAPGDLILYRELPVHHIGIYAGDGRLIHAANPQMGTAISSAWSQRGYTKTLRYWDGASSGVTNDGGDSVTPQTGPPASTISGGTSTTYGVGTSSPAFLGVNIGVGLSGLSAKASSVLDSINGTVPWTALVGEISKNAVTSNDPGTYGSAPNDGLSASSGKGGKWLKQFLDSMGVPEDKKRLVWTLGMRESGGNPDAITGGHKGGWNYNSSGKPRFDTGLFQINNTHLSLIKDLFGPDADMSVLFDPKKNYQVLEHMSSHLTDFSAWGLRLNGSSFTFDWSSYDKDWRDKYQSQTEKNTYEKWNSYDSYSRGAWAVQAEKIARIHQNEMVLPADLAEEVRHEYDHHSDTLLINIAIGEASYQQATQFAQRMKMILEEEEVAVNYG